MIHESNTQCNKGAIHTAVAILFPEYTKEKQVNLLQQKLYDYHVLK